MATLAYYIRPTVAEPQGDTSLMSRMQREKPCPKAVAIIVTRVLAKGREDEFRSWADRVTADAAAAAGHRGGIRLEQTGGLFHTLQQFENRDALRAWQRSDGYRRLEEEGDRFSTPRTQEIEGAPAVARIPADGDGPKWKRFLMSWLGVLPLVLLFNGLLQLLPEQPSWYIRAAVQSCFLVALMTWLVRPAVSRRLKPWAMRDSRGDARIVQGD